MSIVLVRTGGTFPVSLILSSAFGVFLIRVLLARVESAPTGPPSGSLGSSGVAQVTASHKSGGISSLGRPCWRVALGFALGATVSSW
jgi:hypothetical protein